MRGAHETAPDGVDVESNWEGNAGVAALSAALSLASLGNASPLSLVPGFAKDEAAPMGLVRDDSLKLRPFGLTRITRHPLILPMVAPTSPTHIHASVVVNA